MKTKIGVKKINNVSVDVPVNSAEHRIEEIKLELANYLGCQETAKAEVIEMTED